MGADDVEERLDGAGEEEPVLLEWVVSLLDELVRLQETVRRSSLVWGGLYLGLGVVATLALHLLPRLAPLAEIQKLGPLVVLTAAASLHFEPWAVARQRASGLQSLRRLLIRAEGLEGARRRTAIRQALKVAQAISAD